jgi:hypothetical protein
MVVLGEDEMLNVLQVEISRSILEGLSIGHKPMHQKFSSKS